MIPLLVVIIAALALAAAASSSHAAVSPGALPGAPDAPHGSGKYDAGMDLTTEHIVDAMLAQNTDPAELRELAAAMRAKGFTHAAALLEAKALALAAVIPVPNPKPPQPVPPVFVPPAPPPFVPPQPPPPPFVPPAPPAFVPPAPPGSQIYEVGPLHLPPIPAAGHTVTEAHRKFQRALVNFYADSSLPDLMSLGNDIVYPSMQPSGQPQADGNIGPATQLAAGAAQAFLNETRGLSLTIDGLPGPATNAALAEWGA